MAHSDVMLWACCLYSGVTMEGVLGTEGRDSVASSPLEKRMSVEYQIPNSFRPPSPYLIRNQKANFSLEKHAVGAERAASHSSQGLIDHNPGTRPNSNMEPSFYSMDGDGIHVRGAQYENGLFSSSLSELFSRKCKVPTSKQEETSQPMNVYLFGSASLLVLAYRLEMFNIYPSNGLINIWNQFIAAYFTGRHLAVRSKSIGLN